MSQQQIGELDHDPFALGRCQAAPAPVLKRRARRGHCPIDVRFTASGDLPKNTPIYGRNAVVNQTCLRIYALSIDHRTTIKL